MKLPLSFWLFLRAVFSLRCCAYHRASSSNDRPLVKNRVKHVTAHCDDKQIAMEISLYSHHRASCMAWLSGVTRGRCALNRQQKETPGFGPVDYFWKSLRGIPGDIPEQFNPIAERTSR